jgi:hypothetical protein
MPETYRHENHMIKLSRTLKQPAEPRYHPNASLDYPQECPIAAFATKPGSQDSQASPDA